MDIKELNEALSKFLNETDSIDSMLYDRYKTYYGCEKDADGHNYYDFGFIYFGDLSKIAFKKVYPHIDDLITEEKLNDKVVFFTSGDLLSDEEEGYINSGIDVAEGVTLTEELLDKFDAFRNKLYRKYIKFAGYKNTEGDISDITPVKVDFVIEPSENADLDDDVLAVFPELEGSPNEYLCYRHLGQHGSASPDYYKSLNKATKEQYMPLYNELTNQIGYNLNVINEDF